MTRAVAQNRIAPGRKGHRGATARTRFDAPPQSRHLAFDVAWSTRKPHRIIGSCVNALPYCDCPRTSARAPTGRFEPLPTHPRLIETQATARALERVRRKSGCGFQGEVGHDCTNQTLARLRPDRFISAGRRDRRGSIARAEHLIPTLSVRHSGRAATAARAGIHNHRQWLWIPGSRAHAAKLAQAA